MDDVDLDSRHFVYAQHLIRIEIGLLDTSAFESDLAIEHRRDEVDKGGHFAAWEPPELFSTALCRRVGGRDGTRQGACVRALRYRRIGVSGRLENAGSLGRRVPFPKAAAIRSSNSFIVRSPKELLLDAAGFAAVLVAAIEQHLAARRFTMLRSRLKRPRKFGSVPRHDRPMRRISRPRQRIRRI